jgi:hypothetical protein
MGAAALSIERLKDLVKRLSQAIETKSQIVQ